MRLHIIMLVESEREHANFKYDERIKSWMDFCTCYIPHGSFSRINAASGCD